mgnify:CR=1 FL=1
MARLGTKKGGRRKTSRRAFMKTASPKRKRRTTKKKGMLAELIDKKSATAGAKCLVSGAIGGGASVLVEKIFTAQSDQNKALIIAGVGFATATMLKAPYVGAGMGAIAMYKLLEGAGMLAESDYLQEGDWADVSDLPMVLNEDGVPDVDYLQQSNIPSSSVYLHESDYLQENDNSYDVGYYGSGFGGA